MRSCFGAEQPGILYNITEKNLPQYGAVVILEKAGLLKIDTFCNVKTHI